MVVVDGNVILDVTKQYSINIKHNETFKMEAGRFNLFAVRKTTT